MVDIGFILPSSHHHHLTSPPQLAPNGAQAHLVPLPSPEGCGPIAVSLNGGKREGEGGTRGGTHEMGGPSGASQERGPTFVGAPFCPSLLPHPRRPPHLTSMATRTATKGQTTTQRTERRHHKPVENMAGQSTTQSTTHQVNRRHGGPIDDPAG